MTWYFNEVKEGEKQTVVWSEEYPGHHKFNLQFDLLELKQQLGLVEITTEVQ